MRLIYAGTPDFAVSALHALATAGHDILAVYTQPDRPAGRGRKLQPSPVKQAATGLGIDVQQPLSFKEPGARETLAGYQADAMVVAAYGLILPQSVLDLFPSGCINIHASLLPRWRGAAPIQRALMAGDAETGICIMQMEAGLDTGPVISRHTLPIPGGITGGELHDQLAVLGADAIVSSLRTIDGNRAEPVPQDDNLATYAHKLNKTEAIIDWTADADIIERTIRAFNPWPVAQSNWQGKALRLWNASISDCRLPGDPGQIVAADGAGLHVRTGNGVVAITELQLPGKKRVSATDFLNAQAPVGSHLG